MPSSGFKLSASLFFHRFLVANLIVPLAQQQMGVSLREYVPGERVTALVDTLQPELKAEKHEFLRTLAEDEDIRRVHL